MPYACCREDLCFAQKFIERSPVKHGIQRVDACRTRQGGLRLMELEDLNPYLSLDLLPEETRERFVTDLIEALEEMI